MGAELIYGFLAVVALAAAIEVVAYSITLIRRTDAEIERARIISTGVSGQQVDDQELATPAENAHGKGRAE